MVRWCRANAADIANRSESHGLNAQQHAAASVAGQTIVDTAVSVGAYLIAKAPTQSAAQ